MTTVQSQASQPLLVGRYQLATLSGKMHLLGHGAFGSVYLATQIGASQRVAIKILHWPLASHPEIRRRFEVEIRLARRFAHPCLVHVLDDGVLPDGRPFMVMEYLAGVSLNQFMLQYPSGLPVRDALHLGSQLAAALSEMARQGIVNRDLKPSNIMVVRDPQFTGGWRFVIIDFGIAKLLDQEGSEPPLTLPGAMLGTPAYMAPEQIMAPGRVSAQADTYAFGIILFQALTGRMPFVGNLASLIGQQLNAPVPSLHTLRPDVPDDLELLVRAMLSKDPAHANEVDVKSLREGEVGLEMEERGTPDGLDGPLTRDPNPKGGEFIDKHGDVWDVKRPQSKFPKPGKSVVEGAMEDIHESLGKTPKEKVVIDPKDMTPDDLAKLKAEVTKQGLDKDVKYGK